MQTAGEYNTILTVFDLLGLTETFCGGEFTVFAPTDAAFEVLFEQVSLEELMADTEGLAAAVNLHAAEGTYLYADLLGMDTLLTLGGVSISIELNDVLAVIVNGQAEVLEADILASNGVIHKISAVLALDAEVEDDGLCNAESCEFGAASSGCYCDDLCFGYGDCCSNVCEACSENAYGNCADDFACPEGEVAFCDLPFLCAPATAVGDGSCDAALNCEANGGDGGDCTADGCNLGDVLDCNENCATPQDPDGACDSNFACEAFSFDGGDCTADGCNIGEIADCQGDCVAQEVIDAALVNGVCDSQASPANGVDLACAEFEMDNGDCNEFGCTGLEMMDCNDQCVPPVDSFVGNGFCDEALNCELFEEDGGDCVFTSSCCSENPEGLSGCDDAECEALVCAADSFCCSSSYDGICASGAANLCGICQGTCPADSLAGTAMATESMSTLVEVLNISGNFSSLCGLGNWTVFAPTNDAFAAVEGLDEILANPGLLSTILLGHLFDGLFPSTVFTEAMGPVELESVNGSVVIVEFDGNDVLINGTTMVVTADIQASNGIVHVIDSVLPYVMTCGEDELMSCDGTTCEPADWIADDWCDDGLNCATYDFDGGDCL